VGRFCCARLTLYHAICHWRRRLLARLKRELKSELRRRKASTGAAWGLLLRLLPACLPYFRRGFCCFILPVAAVSAGGDGRQCSSFCHSLA
jgi:hypothetical protein